MPNLVGQTVSHYKVLEHLGSGGMGVVYEAGVPGSRGRRAEVDITPPYRNQGSLPDRLRSQELQLVLPVRPMRSGIS